MVGVGCRNFANWEWNVGSSVGLVDYMGLGVRGIDMRGYCGGVGIGSIEDMLQELVHMYLAGRVECTVVGDELCYTGMAFLHSTAVPGTAPGRHTQADGVLSLGAQHSYNHTLEHLQLHCVVANVVA